MTDWSGLPTCCLSCRHHDDDYSEWHDRWYHFCLLGIWFPTKKGACAKQEPMRRGDG